MDRPENSGYLVFLFYQLIKENNYYTFLRMPLSVKYYLLYQYDDIFLLSTAVEIANKCEKR